MDIPRDREGDCAIPFLPLPGQPTRRLSSILRPSTRLRLGCLRADTASLEHRQPARQATPLCPSAIARSVRVVLGVVM